MNTTPSIDVLQTLHFLTDGIVSHLAAVLSGAEVRKGAAGMIWVNLDGEHLGSIAVALDGATTVLTVARIGSDPEKLREWLQLGGFDPAISHPTCAENEHVRPERSFEGFSRGAELVRAVKRMWASNNALPAGSSREIEERIRFICDRFDLNVAEWHYWCKIAGERA